jgi:hypothetical protein
MPTSATLPETFAGELIRPQDARYDAARSLFNGLIDKHPALIARCAGPEDVQAALGHARENDLVVAVRGGGHSSPGYSSCDDGVVIDVSPMKGVAIDAERRTGRFGAGLTWGELDASTAEHGLAVTGGRVTHTGVAGLSLGSGSGWLERLLGPTAANLISAEVVTADGRRVRASAHENPDLLWGLKGGGGNFGVVTEFEFRLHPVGPIVFGGLILHPVAAAGDLLRFYRDFMESAADEVGGGFGFATAPPDEHLPEHVRGVPVAMLVVMHAGDPVEGERALRPLLDWGDPLLAMVQPMPYTAVQALIDDSSPWGIKDYFKVDYLPELPDDAIDAGVRPGGAAHLTADRRRLLAAGRGDGPTRQGHDGPRDAGRQVELLLPGHVDRSRPDRAGDRMVEGVHGGHAPVVRGQGAAELHRRRRPRPAAGVLRRREVPAAGGAQGEVRPGQRLRAQPQHPGSRPRVAPWRGWHAAASHAILPPCPSTTTAAPTATSATTSWCVVRRTS